MSRRLIDVVSCDAATNGISNRGDSGSADGRQHDQRRGESQVFAPPEHGNSSPIHCPWRCNHCPGGSRWLWLPHFGRCHHIHADGLANSGNCNGELAQGPMVAEFQIQERPVAANYSVERNGVVDQ